MTCTTNFWPPPPKAPLKTAVKTASACLQFEALLSLTLAQTERRRNMQLRNAWATSETHAEILAKLLVALASIAGIQRGFRKGALCRESQAKGVVVVGVLATERQELEWFSGFAVEMACGRVFGSVWIQFPSRRIQAPKSFADIDNGPVCVDSMDPKRGGNTGEVPGTGHVGGH